MAVEVWDIREKGTGSYGQHVGCIGGRSIETQINLELDLIDSFYDQPIPHLSGYCVLALLRVRGFCWPSFG